MKRKHVNLAAAATVVVAAAIAPAIGITGNLTRSTRQASMVFAHFDRGANLMRGRHANGWHVEGWIAFLKADLKITDQQLPQWERFASALREDIGRMQELVTAHRGPKDAASAENRRQSAVEQLDGFEALAEAGLHAIQNVAPTFRALYAVLTVNQKENVDRLAGHRHRGLMRH